MFDASEPRSYLGTAILFTAITALPFALLWSVTMSLAMSEPFGKILPLGLAGGAFFGMAFGFVMALFLRGETIRVPVRDPEGFRATLNVSLSQMGYYPDRQFPDFLLYKPSLSAGLMSGRIAVQFDA